MCYIITEHVRNPNVERHHFFNCNRCGQEFPFCKLFETFNPHDPKGFLLICNICDYLRTEICRMEACI